MAFQLAVHRRLAHHPSPFSHKLHSSPPYGHRRNQNEVDFHEGAAFVVGFGRSRGSHGSRQLPVRLRNGEAAGIDIVADNRVAVGVHGGVRVFVGETKVHELHSKCGGVVDDGRGDIGIALEWRSAGGRNEWRVHSRVFDDVGGGGVVRIDIAVDRIDV